MLRSILTWWRNPRLRRAKCSVAAYPISCCWSRARFMSWIAGYLDFARLYRFHEAGSFVVTRAKSVLKAQRHYSRPVDRGTGLTCDQTITLTVFCSWHGFEAPLRRIRFKDPETGKTLDARLPDQQPRCRR